MQTPLDDAKTRDRPVVSAWATKCTHLDLQNPAQVKGFQTSKENKNEKE